MRFDRRGRPLHGTELAVRRNMHAWEVRHADRGLAGQLLLAKSRMSSGGEFGCPAGLRKSSRLTGRLYPAIFRLDQGRILRLSYRVLVLFELYKIRLFLFQNVATSNFSISLYDFDMMSQRIADLPQNSAVFYLNFTEGLVFSLLLTVLILHMCGRARTATGGSPTCRTSS